MDEMTQQNASLVEEAAAASEAMGAQAQELTDLVSYFNLGNDEKTIVVNHDHVQRIEAEAPKSESKQQVAVGLPQGSNNADSDNNDGEWKDF